MSAIWGIISKDKDYRIKKEDADCIQAIYKKKCQLDDYKSIQSNKVLFGCGQQRITSFHEKEMLPIHDVQKGIFFTADCILDNRKELIKRIQEVEMINAESNLDMNSIGLLSDGNLLYVAYRILGEDFVTFVRGLFSIAIWNELTETLTLYSDPASQRCLYYTVQKNTIMFSTLLEPITKTYHNLSENEAYDKDFLLCPKSNIYVVPGETPFKEVYLLKPSRKVTIQKKSEVLNREQSKKINDWKITEKRYVSVLSGFDFSEWNDSEKVIRHFMELYRASIQDACKTSGEVGISVSGGLDSSSIAAIASLYLQEFEKKLYAYTFAAPAELSRKESALAFSNPGVRKSLDETDLVADIKKMYSNMEVTDIPPSQKGFMEGLEECISILEMPLKSHPMEWLFFLIQSAKAKGCKVILTGSFGNTSTSYGYPHHIFYDLYKSGRIEELEQYLQGYCEHQKYPYKETYEKAKVHYEKQLASDTEQELIPDNVFVCPKILEDYDVKSRFSLDQNASFSYKLMDHTDYLSFLNAETLMIYLGIVNTKLGLATNTMLRDPTCDIRMLNFCASVPYHYFSYQGMSRWFIRYGFKELLPDSILGDYEQHRHIFGSWYYKMTQEWDTVFPEIKQQLELYEHPEWIFTNHLSEYLTGVDCKDKATTKWLVHVYALLSLSLFRKEFGEDV